MVTRRVWEALRRRSPLAESVVRPLYRFATWIPVAVWFNSYVATPVAITGHSMYPFFNSDRDTTTRRDWALCWKSWGQSQYGLKPGMIVMFRTPNNPEKRSIKRIVATEGEHVMTRSTNRIIVVPELHIWVEGDIGDDDKSLDSNAYGPISVRLVEGHLTHILYPFHKFGEIAWWEHQLPARKSWSEGF